MFLAYTSSSEEVVGKYFASLNDFRNVFGVIFYIYIHVNIFFSLYSASVKVQAANTYKHAMENAEETETKFLHR